jgi:hypothetical protein
MDIFAALMVIAIMCIVSEMIIRLTKIGTRHTENIERIRHGYPTLDGSVPEKYEEAEGYDRAERLQ